MHALPRLSLRAVLAPRNILHIESPQINSIISQLINQQETLWYPNFRAARFDWISLRGEAPSLN